jgi:hypothetical protein
MTLGQALHELIPAGEPPVTIHGRELDPDSEGVGFQFQLTMNGNLYNGRFSAAYYVVQVQLTKRKAGLGWLIDAMPILEIEHANYDLYGKRSREIAYRDREALETQMLRDLAKDATTFFDGVRKAIPPDEDAVPYGGGRSTPVL